MEWILLAQTKNVGLHGLATKIPTAEYLSAGQVVGNQEIAEVLGDYVASNPQREQRMAPFEIGLYFHIL